MKILNLVSYNILATIYANKETYPYTDERYLSHNYRSALIKNDLKNMIDRGCVICLQEVNYEWYSDLLVFFSQNKYNFLIESYGNKLNDYMGVAIAYPITFNLIYYRPVKVKDEIYKNITDKYKKKLEDYSKKKDDSNLKFIPCDPNAKKIIKPIDSLSFSLEKNNVVMFLIIKNGQKNYAIGNYHMPCAFADPGAMVIHGLFYTNICVELNKKYNKNGALFMCADMNTKPTELLIKLLENDSNHKDPFFVKFPLEKMFNIDLLQNNIYSIYKYLNGDEPEYTNYVLNKNKENPNGMYMFRETLDYIFTNNIKNISKKSIACVNSFDRLEEHYGVDPLPNARNISDHLFLYSKIKLLH